MSRRLVMQHCIVSINSVAIHCCANVARLYLVEYEIITVHVKLWKSQACHISSQLVPITVFLNIKTDHKPLFEKVYKKRSILLNLAYTNWFHQNSEHRTPTIWRLTLPLIWNFVPLPLIDHYKSLHDHTSFATTKGAWSNSKLCVLQRIRCPYTHQTVLRVRTFGKAS